MLVLQSCTDSLHIQPGSSGESHATSSDGACNFSSMEVEEDVDVIEEGFVALNEEADISIKQEEIPEDITFPDIKSEPDVVSYVFVCVCVCVCVLLDTIYQCAATSVFFNFHVGNKNIFLCSFWEGGWRMCGRFCKRWVELRLIAGKIEICSYLHVVKILHPQNDS
jgi:hypothetical protein